MEARTEVAQRGLRFLGAAGATKISPYDRATSFEPLCGRHPTFAVGREQGDARRVAAGALWSFRAAYRAALERWCDGLRSVVFPAGTWWMRVFHHAGVSDVDVALGRVLEWARQKELVNG